MSAASIGVLAAVTVATACAIQGTVVDGIVERGDDNLIAVKHPMGEFTDELEVDGPPEALKLKRAALLRTTRRLFEGNVLIPAEIWDGKQNLSQAAE
jgi:4-oxalomesaconate tautomerase